MLVLDVGCGDRPRGSVNLDLHVGRAEDLYFASRQIDPREIPNFVKGDAHHLPFRSNVFQKVLSRHTLEHLSDPILAIREMIRVANGLIEIRTPERFHERFQAFFVPNRRTWIEKHHKHHFSAETLSSMVLEARANCRVRYSFYIFTVLKDLRAIRRSRITFLRSLFYSFGSAFFPPIPDELVASVQK